MAEGDDDNHFNRFKYYTASYYCASPQRKNTYGYAPLSRRRGGGGGGIGPSTKLIVASPARTEADRFVSYRKFREIRERIGVKDPTEIDDKNANDRSTFSIDIKLDASHCGEFVRDFTNRNIVPFGTPEPLPLEQPKDPAEKGSVPLDEITDEELAAHVAERELRPEFAAALEKARAAKASFQKAARPPMPLPTVAPKLWRDRPPGMTPTEFVRQVYAPWIEAGVLTRKSIEDCDPALANAYSKRKSEYPDEAIPLARAVHPRMIADPQEAGEHYRAKGRERTARYRNRDKMAHEPK